VNAKSEDFSLQEFTGDLSKVVIDIINTGLFKRAPITGDFFELFKLLCFYSCHFMHFYLNVIVK